MSQNVVFNNASYTLPNNGDKNWGTNVTSYLVAIASGTLQLSGGSFPLTAEVDFGGSFGLKSLYLKSRTANAASAGQIRLANADTIKFRNGTNAADLSVGISANRLTFEGSTLLIAGAGEIVNADISPSAAIAYSKLNLTGSILNADINASAAIATTKLAALSASIVPVTNASGFLTSSSTTTTELGYVHGVTSAIQTQLDAKASTNLSNVASVSADVPMNSHKFTGLAAGASNGDSVRFEQIFYGFQAASATTTVSTSTTTSSTYQTSNLSRSFTPTSASHRVKVTVSTSLLSATSGKTIQVSLFRDSTDLDGGGNGFATFTARAANDVVPCAFTWIDSPASTSAITYALKFKSTDNTSSVSVIAGERSSIICEEIV